jgi:hypothetical protein
MQSGITAFRSMDLPVTDAANHCAPRRRSFAEVAWLPGRKAKERPKTELLPVWRQTDRNTIRGVVSVLEVPQIDHIAKPLGITITDMKITKTRATSRVVLILLSAVAMTASPQSSKGPSTPAVAPKVRPAFPQEQVPANQQQDAASREKAEADKARREAQAQEERRLAQETQARGYWIDPSTSLMWEGKDNGIAVTWHKAASYCRNLRLAGHADWRLATLDELASLVDKSTATPERVGSTETFSINLGNVGRYVRGCVSLSGNPWSSNRNTDRFGHPYGDGDFFDFVTSKPSGDLPYFRNTKFALCVRSSRE